MESDECRSPSRIERDASKTGATSSIITFQKNLQIQSNYKLEFLKKRKKVTDGSDKKHDLMEIERLNQKRSIRLSQMD